MSYSLNKTMSFSAVRSFVVRCIAGLDAAGLVDLAVPWRTMKETVATCMAAQLAEEEREATTSARVRVCDAAWDEAVAELSKKAFYLAGGDAKAAPFAALFGTVKASTLQRLGPAKATVAAGALLAKVATLNEPELAAAAKDLAAKTEALAIAEVADAEAELKLASHGIERMKTLRQLETLIAETEAKILTLHPGNAELVRAILNPNEQRRPTRRAERGETPVAPGLEVE